MKLYGNAFVEVLGFSGPQAVTVSSEDPEVFEVVGHRYRKDGRPARGVTKAPMILLVYSRGCSLHRPEPTNDQ